MLVSILQYSFICAIQIYLNYNYNQQDQNELLSSMHLEVIRLGKAFYLFVP